MDLAVLLYRDAENSGNLPLSWPARVEEWDDHKPPWIRMTKNELNDFKASHIEEYKKWRLRWDYENNYMQRRKFEYPKHEESIEALIEMADMQYSDRSKMPPKIKAIIEIREAIDRKYPDPESVL